MGFYIPSIYTVLSALVVVAVIAVSRTSLLILAGIALVILGIAMYQHVTLFSGEYQSFRIVNALVPFVPYIMVGAIIFFSTLYIMFFQGGTPSSTAATTPSKGWFGSSPATGTAQTPNYSRNVNNSARYANSAQITPRNNSLQREYLSALDRGI